MTNRYDLELLTVSAERATSFDRKQWLKKKKCAIVSL